MSLEERIRDAAAADPTISGIFGSGSPLLLRWYNTQLPPGNVPKAGTCLRAQRISTSPLYGMQGLFQTNWVRMQFDILDLSSITALTASDAIINWLGTVSFGNLPDQFANFLLNQRGGLQPQLQPPVYVQTLDFRIFNLED